MLLHAVFIPYKSFVDVLHYGASGTYKTLIGDDRGAAADYKSARNGAFNTASDLLLARPNVAIVAGVNYLGAAQTALGIEKPARRLTLAERTLLFPIFWNSVDYDAVSIEEGNVGIMSVTDSAAFTMGHRIRVVSPARLPLSSFPELLVHEMVHVWQFENGGPDYVSGSIMAQAFGGSSAATNNSQGYDFDNALNAGRNWPEFNAEQQAEFIESAFVATGPHVNFASPHPFFMFNGTDRSIALEVALDSIRRRINTPYAIELP